jgi:site-specific recombinase XerD
VTDRDLSPREAVHRYINARRTDWAEATAQTNRLRLALWVDWAETEGIERVSELDGWLLDTYKNTRAGDGIAPATLESEMKTMRNFLEYLERIEIVDDGLSEKVPIPDVDEADKSSDTKLPTHRALPLLQYYRDTPDVRGTRAHALLELAWHTGARSGGLRGLDVRDHDLEEHVVEFHHRPDSGTRLKNGLAGERPVAVPPAVSDVVETYREHYRQDTHDDHGRQPLLTTRNGRMGENTVRRVMYAATFPCHYQDCPHGRERETCEYTEHNQQSKCPSSRSPHQVRTGSITWQRDLGFPPEVVAERVNASVEVIQRHYDKASQRERLERRRRPYVERMDLTNDSDTETDA